MRYAGIILIFILSFTTGRNFLHAQTNAEQVMMIGRNVMSMEDYMLAIQYFNQAIKARPHLADPYFYRALAKLNLDDYAGAEEDCNLAIERNPFKPETYKLRGFIRQTAGNDSLAIEDYNKGLLYNPTDKYFLFYKAIALTELKKFDEAGSVFETLLRQNPDFEEAFTALSLLNLEKGDTVAAIDNLNRALQISKTQVNPYLMLAEINWKQKNWEKAGEALDNAIRLKPESASLYVNRAFVRYNDDDFSGAMDDYNYAIQLEPDNSAAIFNRGLLRYEVKDLERSKDDFGRVLELDPDNFHALYNLGLVNLELGENRQALANFKKITEKYPRFYPVYYAMAEAERDMGNMRDAIRYARYGDNLVEKYVQNPEVNKLDRPTIAAAESYDRKTDNKDESEEEVMEKFNRLVTVSVHPSESLSFSEQIKGKVQDRDVNIEELPLFNISFASDDISLKSTSNYFRELDDLNRAQLINDKFYVSNHKDSKEYQEMLPTLFEKADILRKKVSDSGSSGRPVDYLALGVALTMLHNYQDAIHALDNALAIDPGFSAALMQRGYARFEEAESERKGLTSGDALDQRLYESLLQESMADFDSAVAGNPRLIYAYFNKGNIYYLTGDARNAINEYRRAIAVNPEFGEAYFNLGLALLKTGDKESAFENLSKAGELGIIQSYNLLKRMKSL